MSRSLSWAAALVGLAFAAPVRALATPRIAIFPLDIRYADGKLSPNAEVSLEEMLRDTAVTGLASDGWSVLSGDATAQGIKDAGQDAAHCGDEQCHLTVAHALNATLFVSGSVQFVDGDLTASIRVYDVNAGRILTTERVSGVNVAALRNKFEGKAPDFFGRIRFYMGSGKTPAAGDTTQADKSVPSHTEKATPVTAMAPAPEPVREKPAPAASDVASDSIASAPSPADDSRGDEQVPPVATPAAPVTRTAPASSDLDLHVSADSISTLSVVGTPEGAHVTVTDAEGSVREGVLPWRQPGLSSERYRVEVSQKGFMPADVMVDLKPGKKTKVTVNLKKAAVVAPRPATHSCMSDIDCPGDDVCQGEVCVGARAR
jgi:hypothetical protein